VTEFPEEFDVDDGGKLIDEKSEAAAEAEVRQREKEIAEAIDKAAVAEEEQQIELQKHIEELEKLQRIAERQENEFKTTGEAMSREQIEFEEKLIEETGVEPTPPPPRPVEPPEIADSSEDSDSEPGSESSETGFSEGGAEVEPEEPDIYLAEDEPERPGQE
jgi:hypothetical protein